MSKQVGWAIYVTWHEGTCLLFEKDLRTYSVGVVDGTRALMPTELRVLERHLNTVMQSVRITP